LEESVYVYQLKGFEQRSENGETLICLFNRVFYGLKQSTRVWYGKIKGRLEKLGFIVFPMDDSCFIHKEINLIVTLYVDDIQYLGEKLEDVT
jgi:Reverse transcriptase (RNA-dependent DNA polymerase)